MARVISFANQKGGVAKTTSTFNVSACLAKRGNKVLMIDLDPQASLTIYAGLEPYEHDKSIVDVLKNQRQDIKECIVKIRDNLDIITSRIELSGVENGISMFLKQVLIVTPKEILQLWKKLKVI